MIDLEAIHKLRIVMVAHPDEQTRLAAGLKIVEKCRWNEDKSDALLLDMARDKGLPESLRTAAGMKAVENTSGCGRLLEISERNGVPDSVRTAAGSKAVTTYKENGRYEVLSEISNNKELPSEIRELAKQSFEAAALRAVERYTWEKSHRFLVEMAKEKELPMEIRVKAGLNVVKGYGKKEDYGALVKMAKGLHFPEEVKNAATAKLAPLAEKIAGSMSIDKEALAEYREKVQLSVSAGLLSSVEDEMLTKYREKTTEMKPKGGKPGQKKKVTG